MSEPGDRFLICDTKHDRWLHLVHGRLNGQWQTWHDWSVVEAAERFNERTALAIMRQVGRGDGLTVMVLAARWR